MTPSTVTSLTRSPTSRAPLPRPSPAPAPAVAPHGSASVRLTGWVVRDPVLLFGAHVPPGCETVHALLRIWITQGPQSLLTLLDLPVQPTRAAHHIASRTARQIRPGHRVTAHAERITLSPNREHLVLLQPSLIEQHDIDTTPPHIPAGDRT